MFVYPMVKWCKMSISGELKQSMGWLGFIAVRICEANDAVLQPAVQCSGRKSERVKSGVVRDTPWLGSREVGTWRLVGWTWVTGWFLTTVSSISFRLSDLLSTQFGWWLPFTWVETICNKTGFSLPTSLWLEWKQFWAIASLNHVQTSTKSTCVRWTNCCLCRFLWLIFCALKLKSMHPLRLQKEVAAMGAKIAELLQGQNCFLSVWNQPRLNFVVDQMVSFPPFCWNFWFCIFHRWSSRRGGARQEWWACGCHCCFRLSALGTIDRQPIL